MAQPTPYSLQRAAVSQHSQSDSLASANILSRSLGSKSQATLRFLLLLPVANNYLSATSFALARLSSVSFFLRNLSLIRRSGITKRASSSRRLSYKLKRKLSLESIPPRGDYVPNSHWLYQARTRDLPLNRICQTSKKIKYFDQNFDIHQISKQEILGLFNRFQPNESVALSKAGAGSLVWRSTPFRVDFSRPDFLEASTWSSSSGLFLRIKINRFRALVLNEIIVTWFF